MMSDAPDPAPDLDWIERDAKTLADIRAETTEGDWAWGGKPHITAERGKDGWSEVGLFVRKEDAAYCKYARLFALETRIPALVALARRQAEEREKDRAEREKDRATIERLEAELADLRRRLTTPNWAPW